MTGAFRHAVITGASSGLGAALAEAFASPQIRLSLTGRDQVRLRRTADACSGKGAEVATTTLDLQAPDTLEKWIAAMDAAKPVDLAIACAGVLVGHKRPAELEDAGALRAQIDVNLTGACRLLSAAATLMLPRRTGRLVAVSSLAGLQPLADEPAYSASKAGLNAYCEAMREYLRPHGIGVTLLCPGYVSTPMADGFLGARPLETTPEQAAARMARAIARGRAFDAFPEALLWSIRVGRLAPWRVRAAITRSLRFRFPRG